MYAIRSYYGGTVNDKNIINSISNGKLTITDLDKVIERLLKVIFKAVDAKEKDYSKSSVDHHLIAKEAATESMILLKNENEILPLKKDSKLAVIGAMAKVPRYQGAGSYNFV